MDLAGLSLDLTSLAAAYRDGASPVEVMHEVLRRCTAHAGRGIWIALRSPHDVLGDAAALASRPADALPLYGVPFAIKDNIDLAAVETSAGCPQFAYLPQRSAHVVQRLVEAGAIPIGKANLDQFATGLSGTRCVDAYGFCTNSFDPAFIAGGSSSGSAVAVALGLVAFALGTDTAGSGRIPAAFNNLVGVKPTRGLLGCSGVVPACRTLDCVSIFALNAADAGAVFEVASAPDPQDPYARADRLQAPPLAAGPARFRFGLPRPGQLVFDGDPDAARNAFAAAAGVLQAAGGDPVEIDFAPFAEAAQLLYGGPWVAERYAAIAGIVESCPEALHPVTRAVIEPARGLGAVEAFQAQYRLQALRVRARAVLDRVDVVLTPTAPALYSVAQMLADPVTLNSRLGSYTNFMNLLDLCAIAVPSGFTPDGLPFGVTLFAPANADLRLLDLAARMESILRLPLGATGVAWRPPAGRADHPGAAIELAVCGAHMRGLPLNCQLTSLGAVFLGRVRTAPAYRLHALTRFSPPRPGLVRVAGGGMPIECEIWSVPRHRFGDFIDLVPAPLAIGRIELEDGRWTHGFLCEQHATEGAPDISRHGGWRAWLVEQT
ncbi:MAG: allophanate hydrolase [Gammaproteobacteria bacterium]